MFDIPIFQLRWLILEADPVHERIDFSRSIAGQIAIRHNPGIQMIALNEMRDGLVPL